MFCHTIHFSPPWVWVPLWWKITGLGWLLQPLFTEYPGATLLSWILQSGVYIWGRVEMYRLNVAAWQRWEPLLGLFICLYFTYQSQNIPDPAITGFLLVSALLLTNLVCPWASQLRPTRQHMLTFRIRKRCELRIEVLLALSMWDSTMSKTT